jgi:diguanylate cyclase (GGDEF)-like protein/PAS domain S-box-containing protein
MTAKAGRATGADVALRTGLERIADIAGALERDFAGCDGSLAARLQDLKRTCQDLLPPTPPLAAGGDIGIDIHDFLAMSPDAIFLCRDGLVVTANDAALRLLALPRRSDIENQPLERFIHADYRLLAEGNFQALLGEDSATPMKFATTDGRPLDVVVTAAAAPGQGIHICLVVRDISDVIRANREVATQVRRLNSILDTAVDAIVVTDEAGHIETFNHSAESMFLYPAKHVIGQPIDGLMATESVAAIKGKIKSLLASRHTPFGGNSSEVVGRRRDDSTFPAEISLSLCRLDDRRLFTAIFRDVTERRTFEDYLAHSANHDSLTGLPNRRLLEQRLQEVINDAVRDGSRFAVWFIDLDGFKMVNDVMGHAAGDELLVEAGRRMRAAVRPIDILARFGGDEFAVITRDISRPGELESLAQAFLAEMTHPFALRGRELTLAANIGIATYPDHALQTSDLVVHASAAMMFAKAAGRNQVRFFDPAMHSQSAERLTLENELRRAIEREELLLHYQPQVNAISGRIHGLEALVRWRHPRLGLVSPARFIPLAEQTGLIVPLGKWILHQACRDIRILEDAGFDAFTVGVNISARQFADSDVFSLIEDAIAHTGIDPRHLDVEITESTLMNDPEHVIAYLDRMKGLGISLSIDDFGTGYSSLNYLKRFPVDTLKIDRSFIIDIAHNPKDEAIAVTIVTLAHHMGMTVLAEGVEHPEQARILARHGCDRIQGFLYCEPIPLADILRLLTAGGRLAEKARPADRATAIRPVAAPRPPISPTA